MTSYVKCRAAKLGLEAANNAAEIKLRAERKTGELLAQLERDKPKPYSKLENGSPSPYRAVLTESEIAPTTAHRWQTIATIPEETFVDVGRALLEIRDARLYRHEFGTFEDYCRERWNLKRQRAYELMDAASIVSNLSEISDIPMREAHVAPLAPLAPDMQRDVWQRAVETAPNGRQLQLCRAAWPPAGRRNRAVSRRRKNTRSCGSPDHGAIPLRFVSGCYAAWHGRTFHS